MSPDWPAESLLTVTFTDYEGKTKVTLRHAGIPSGADYDGAQEGWTQSLERLAEYVAKA